MSSTLLPAADGCASRAPFIAAAAAAAVTAVGIGALAHVMAGAVIGSHHLYCVYFESLQCCISRCLPSGCLSSLRTPLQLPHDGCSYKVSGAGRLARPLLIGAPQLPTDLH